MAANPPDFALLYARLGLAPDCTLAQFKHACRQRIAELHPDKAPPGAAAAMPDLPISDLIALYVSAIRFHRRHGRLPGGQPVVTRVATLQEQPRPSAHFSEASVPDPRGDATPLSWRSWLLAAMAVALLLALLASLDREPSPAVPNPAPVETADDGGQMAEDAAAATSQLELGMDRTSVLAIQGEPMQRDNRDWIYGPSWIRFEKGRVVDWYSSPLHRLRTPTPTPTEAAPGATDPR